VLAADLGGLKLVSLLKDGLSIGSTYGDSVDPHHIGSVDLKLLVQFHGVRQAGVLTVMASPPQT
jgi:hypothetical protein